jgi:hypothetical protein
LWLSNHQWLQVANKLLLLSDWCQDKLSAIVESLEDRFKLQNIEQA